MSLKTLQTSVLAALVGVTAGTALAQIPVPVPGPLPGLEVRFSTGRPPALRHERPGPRPGPNHVWVAGFWDSDGARWRWIPGRWEQRAAPDAYWIAPRYVRSTRGYIYEPGHWSTQTIVVGDDVRRRPEWQRHEREHDRELERERDRDRYRDQFRDRDHDRDHQ
jgi:WXXGXW repeat (2 copies)